MQRDRILDIFMNLMTICALALIAFGLYGLWTTMK